MPGKLKSRRPAVWGTLGPSVTRIKEVIRHQPWSRAHQDQKLDVTEPTVWASSVHAADWSCGKLGINTHYSVEEHRVNRMRMGQYSLVTQMHISNLITIQTLINFWWLKKMDPYRNFSFFPFSTCISHFVFWHIKLGNPQMFLFGKNLSGSRQMGKWTIWCYYCMQCKSR